MNHLQREYNTEGVENVTPETKKLKYLYVIYREEDPKELPLDSVSLSELAHFMGLSKHATAQRFRRSKNNKVHHGSFIIEQVNIQDEAPETCHYCGKEIETGHVFKKSEATGDIAHYACTECTEKRFTEKELGKMYDAGLQYFTYFEERMKEEGE